MDDQKKRSDWLLNIWSAISDLRDRMKRVEKHLDLLEDEEQPQKD